MSDLGNEAKAQAMISKILDIADAGHQTGLEAIYAWLGENDLAFEWLEKSFQQREFRLANFLGDIWFRNLTTDPRYPGFVEKLGLLDEWKSMPPEYGGPSEH